MTVAFVVDTSASMNQRCANGLSLLDCAKSAVEHFVKMRLRDLSWHRTDRYLLVTCDDVPNAIKMVDRYPFANFMRALKGIEAHDLTEIGSALQQLLDYLHLQRLANDIDKYGQGRYPCSIEPTTIILLTDGTELTTKAGVLKTIVPSGPPPLGAELSTKPFRWDQRVFAIVLRIPSVSQQVLERSGPLPQNAPISGSQTAVAMDTDISAFCESTGGKCYVATSWKILMQHIEVTSRLSTCVVVSFENIPIPGAAPPPPQVHAACQRKLLFIRANQPHQGHWPIPEVYWPDPSQQTLPPREPHPVIYYKAIDSDPSIPAQFMYDKYDIEFNPVASFLSKSTTPGLGWQVFVRNSKGPSHGYGDAFGYLRLWQNTLSLYVLPYNYPTLWHLLEQASKIPKVTNLPQWRQDMERYCNSIPSYYGPPLRAALRQWGLNVHVVPDSLEKSLFAGFVGTHLKRLKAQAKTECDSMTEKIMNTNVSTVKSHERVFPFVSSGSADAPGTHTYTTTSFSVRLSSSSSSSSPNAVADPILSQKSHDVSVPAGPSSSIQNTKFLTPSTSDAKSASEGNNSAGSLKDAVLFKNPFDVPRNELLSQLKYLPIRVAVSLDARNATAKGERGSAGKQSSLGTLIARIVAKEEEEARHSLPIEKMGDFSDALLKPQPPRNPFADEQERNKQQRSLFGNPYRQEKNEAADEAWLEGSGGAQARGRKRRRRPESSASTSSSECSTDGLSSGGNEVNSPSKKLQDGKGLVPSDNRHKEAMASGADIVDGIGQTSGKYATADEADSLMDASNQLPQRNTESTNEDATVRKSIIRCEEASEFVLATIRELRHSRPQKTQKLFELLSTPEFPVDKASLLEQLIQQAHSYKKSGVAIELTDYRNKFLASQAQAA